MNVRLILCHADDTSRKMLKDSNDTHVIIDDPRGLLQLKSLSPNRCLDPRISVPIEFATLKDANDRAYLISHKSPLTRRSHSDSSEIITWTLYVTLHHVVQGVGKGPKVVRP